MSTTDISHRHEYKDPVKYVPINEVQSNYKGVAGDTAFLIRTCSCGKDMPFEFGKADKMKAILKKLTTPSKEKEDK